MGRDRDKGVFIDYTPSRPKLELDTNCTENICNRMNNLVLQEGIYYALKSGNTPWVRAKYTNGFNGGTKLMVRKDEENINQWNAWVSSGILNQNYIAFEIDNGNDEGNLNTSIINHSFKEGSYTYRNVSEWFDNALKSIEVAKERGAFQWEDASS